MSGKIQRVRQSAARRLKRVKDRNAMGTVTAAVTGAVLGNLKRRGVKVPALPMLPPNTTLSVVSLATALYVKNEKAQAVALDVCKGATAVASYELAKGGGVSGDGDDDTEEVI